MHSENRAAEWELCTAAGERTEQGLRGGDEADAVPLRLGELGRRQLLVADDRRSGQRLAIEFAGCDSLAIGGGRRHHAVVRRFLP